MKVLIFDRAKNREKLLQAYPGIYGVDSETNNNVTYGISDNQFSVIKTCGVIALRHKRNATSRRDVRRARVKRRDYGFT